MNLYLFSFFILICLVVSIIEMFKRKSIVFLDIILVSFYILIVSYRSVDGTPDTAGYVDEYSSLSVEKFFTIENENSNNNYEYGYTFTSQIIKKLLGNNIILFFGIIACINLVAVWVYFKKIVSYSNSEIQVNLLSSDFNNGKLESYNNFLFAPFFSLFVSYFGFMYSGIVLRQSLAMTVFFIASYFFFKKKYFLGLIILFLSFAFHNMAFFSIGILIFMFTGYTFKKSSYYLFLFLFLFLYLIKFFTFLSPLILNFLFQKFSGGAVSMAPEKLNTYLGGSLYSTSYSLSIIANFIFLFFSIKLSDKNNKLQQKLIQIYLFAVAGLSLTAGIMAVSRATDYYLFFNLLLFYLVFVNRKITLATLAFFCIIVISNSILFFRLAIL